MKIQMTCRAARRADAEHKRLEAPKSGTARQAAATTFAPERRAR